MPKYFQIVTGAALMVRREIFSSLGGFDEAYWNGNEDVDLCLRAGESGWKVVYRPESVIIHFESQSGEERWAKVQDNVRRFNEIWDNRA
jgi:GT2 family glycosyltransferase